MPAASDAPPAHALSRLSLSPAAAALPPPPSPPAPRPRVPVRVHARLHPDTALPSTRAASIVTDWLAGASLTYRDGELPLDGAPPAVAAAVDRVAIVDTAIDAAAPQGQVLLFWQIDLHVTAYAAFDDDPAVALADGDGDGDDANEASLPLRETALPARRLDGALPALVLPPSVKRTLLSRLGTGLALAAAGVPAATLGGGGRVVLLHGPPGSGKSSLCRAVAHRLAVDHGARFEGGCLMVEVSAATLFSKWFGASSKAVARVFARAASLAVDDGALVVVVIDEVESLASGRARAAGGGGGGGGGGDPGDAARAVNALLTGIDALAAVPGVVLLCTTNVPASLDAAFVDRCDVRLGVPPPDAGARAAILGAALADLVAAGVVARPPDGNACGLDAALAAVAAAADGVSGRALRRLPLAALAELGCWRRRDEGSGGAVDAGAYVGALRAAVEAEVAGKVWG